MNWLITGANGHLGRKLIEACGGHHRIVALVRSERARQQLSGLPCEAVITDYRNVAELTAELSMLDVEAWDALIGLTGTIWGRGPSDYYAAHESVSEFLGDVVARIPVRRLVSLSICGADASAKNACLASRGAADDILRHSVNTPVSILRLPMILGENDHASRALAKKARAKWVFSFRADSLEQPIAASDVIAAIQAMIHGQAEGVFDLAGPESIKRADLIRRAGAILGRTPVIISLPLSAGQFFARVLTRLMDSPPITEPMLGVLDHDDAVDCQETLHRLKLQLTPLNRVLQDVL